MLQVKLFDFEHEADLEEAVNDFLQTVQAESVVSVDFQVAVADAQRHAETVFCFSAMVVYRSK